MVAHVRMARLVFVAISAILLSSFAVANDSEDDSAESSEETSLECQDNEVIDDCPVDCPSDYCPKSRYDDQSKCCKPKKCPPPACKCGFNSRRSANGTCISTRTCPPFKCNGRHEEYNPCPSYCPGESCSQATADGKCHLGFIGITVECKPACRCKKNYWRLNGICVSYSKCPKNNNTTHTTVKPKKSTTKSPQKTKKPKTATDKPTLVCGDDEVVDDCPSNCPADYCPKSRHTNQSSCPKPKNCPPPRCKCRFNFRRAQNGTCIPTRNCPPFKCNGKNEVFNSCPPLCPGESCQYATPDGACHAIGRILIPLMCKPACRCKKNYWRLNGNCVPYNKCPKTNNTTTVTTEKPPETTEGTTENQNSTVGPQLTCGDNEIAVDCPADCPFDYCPKNRNDASVTCTKPAKCPPPACKCRFNTRRADNGSCINTRDCPPFTCDGPHEVYDPCPPYCPGENCSQATPDGKCHIFGTILIVLQCRPACRCQKNYWRLNGTCVPYEKCPNRNDTIITTEKPPPKVTTKKSTTTKPATEKPNLKCGPHQTIDDCPVDCRINYCPKSENYVYFPCPRPKKCPPPACRCAIDTHRLANGSCVRIQDCPPFECTRINEEYRACYPESPGEDCADAVAEPTNEYVVKCKPACRCKKNHWRLNGVCVPYEKCNSCPENEDYVECKSACSKEYCPKSEADTEPSFCTQQCRGSGCVCRFNHKRAPNGTCIPARDCPPFDCSARPNEEFDPCPSYCPTDKCNEATPTGECPVKSRSAILLHCSPKCRCIKGYWRNSSGICVSYEKCLQECPANEEYTNCTQRLCRRQYCTDVSSDDKGADCEPDKVEGCQSGCVCKVGYLRSDNGTCVPEDACENSIPTECCGLNEEYTDCKETCPGDTCAALTSKMKCEDECCESGCVCRDGYRRKSVNGICIPLCQCPEMANAPACQASID